MSICALTLMVRNDVLRKCEHKTARFEKGRKLFNICIIKFPWNPIVFANALSMFSLSKMLYLIEAYKWLNVSSRLDRRQTDALIYIMMYLTVPLISLKKNKKVSVI